MGLHVSITSSTSCAGVYIVYVVSVDFTCKNTGKSLCGRKEVHVNRVKGGKENLFQEFSGKLLLGLLLSFWRQPNSEVKLEHQLTADHHSACHSCLRESQRHRHCCELGTFGIMYIAQSRSSVL